MDVFATNFKTIDWIIVLVYICIPVVIGILVRKYIQQISDFIVAGRSLRIFIAIATLTGTELGLVTVMYNAELGFKHGFSAYHTTVCNNTDPFNTELVFETLCYRNKSFHVRGVARHDFRTDRITIIVKYHSGNDLIEIKSFVFGAPGRAHLL